MKLVIESIVKDTAVEVIESTNRVLVVDCSGSMGSELPKLRVHLKNKLPTMILPGDTLTIIWFSGRAQCGVLFEGIKLDTLQDIQKVNTAIDRYLTPIGLTSFTEPLEEVLKLTDRLKGNFTLSFMSDGSDNVGTKSNILNICSKLSERLTSATMVEYGFYADHFMLMGMAQELGGSVVLADNFNSYQESLDSSMKTQTTNKKIKIKNIKSDFVVGNSDSGFVIAVPDAVGTVTLPSNVNTYSYLTEGSGIETNSIYLKDSAFMVSALIMRGQADQALELASLIGDTVLYKTIENSFSKQDYVTAVEIANKIGQGKLELFSELPRQTNLIPDENAYNVLTLLMDLANHEGNYLHISHPDFEYSPIGHKKETVEDESRFKPVFTNKPGEIKAEISALKFDEDRPNISILTRRDGTVSLPDNEFGFGNSVESFIWRNYAIVKDGIVNLRKLPVILSKVTHDHFTKLGVVSEPFSVGKTYVIDTKLYPIINRAMATPSTASDMFKMYFDMYKLKVRQKILGTKIEKPEFGSKFSSLYGEAGTLFLKSYGVSEGGFSPKSVKSETVDPYISKVLEIKLSSLSSIPKVEDVEKAIASGKVLTPSQKVMSDMMSDLIDCKDFEKELKETKVKIRELMDRIVQIKFGIIIGKRWFVDMASIEDNTQEIDFGFSKIIKCQACLEDKEV